MLELSATYQLIIIAVLGTAMQVLAWRVGFPSIVLLLISGILVGPVFNLVHPDQIFGDLLPSIIELAVAVVLFEGGTTLAVKDFPVSGRIALSLVSICAGLTFLGVAVCAVIFFNVPWITGFVLGSILVVSGPTVIGPLIRVIRPRAPLGEILRWEGILIDPVGVTLAVLVAEVARSAASYTSLFTVAWGILFSIGVGLVFGILGGIVATYILRRHLVPDQLHFPVVLAILFAAVACANILGHEAGLLAATIMGLFIAERGGRPARFLIELSANMQPILVAFLFIVLSARLLPDHLRYFSFASISFVLVIIFVVRPLATYISTLNTELSFRQKLLLGFVAPRGIVAASLASVLALDLAEKLPGGSDILVPITFLTIIGTVLCYGIFSPLIAKGLGVRSPEPQGVLLIGSNWFSRSFAKALKEQGVHVELADSSSLQVATAKRQELICHHGNALSDLFRESIDFGLIGYCVAMTQNEEANSLASVEYRHALGSAHVYQLASADSQELGKIRTQGRWFANPGLSWSIIDECKQNNYSIKTRSDIEKTPEEEGIFTLAQVKESGKVLLISPSSKLTWEPGDRAILFSQ